MKNSARLLLVLFVSLLFSSPVFSQQSAQSFYRQGLEQLKNVKYDLAIASFSEAVKINPKFTDAYLQRAKARQNNQRDLEGAMKDVEKALELNPSFGEAYYERAQIRYAQSLKSADKNREIAEEEFTALFNNMLADLDAAINYGFKTKDAYLRRAALKCHDLNKCAEAVADYDAAIMFNPDDLIVYTSRANAKRISEDLSGAIADLSEVVTRYNIKQNAAPNAKTGNVESSNSQAIDTTAVALALNNLGGLLRQKGNNELALNAYIQAIAIAPKSPFGYEGRAQYKIVFGDLDEAIADFNKAIELSAHATSYIYRGAALQIQGKTVEAQKDFDKAVELASHLKDRIESMVERVKAARAKYQPSPSN